MIEVCAGVILRSGAVLLGRRAPGRTNAGKWEFPGGRVEAGETPAEALRRELKEELNIDATVGAELTRSRAGDVELIALLVTKFSGELTLTDHDKTAWVEARRVLEYDLVPADVPIAQVVASHRRRERYSGTHPRTFQEKYKELGSDAEAIAKAKARGSTPAGMHLPVMMTEVLEALAPLEGSTILDCTLGWGGHSAEFARRGASVIGLDRDGEELTRTAERLKKQGLSITARHTDYSNALAVLKELGVNGVDAVFADLGVSSMQLDRPDRGMSFKTDGPLDMRMDRANGPTAAQWIAAASEEEIAEALRRYGDEPDAAAIARSIKAKAPKTTYELAAAVGLAKGLGAERVTKKHAFAAHPATRTFQALRIAVNSERGSLQRLLEDLPALVKPSGRAVFLTFHSGEEALVQGAFRSQAALWKPVEGPLRPTAEEVRENPRARSTRLWRAVRS